MSAFTGQIRLQHLLVLDVDSSQRDIRLVCDRVVEAGMDIDNVDRQTDGSCAIEISHWIEVESLERETKRVRTYVADLYGGSRTLSPPEYAATEKTGLQGLVCAQDHEATVDFVAQAIFAACRPGVALNEDDEPRFNAAARAALATLRISQSSL